MSGTITFDDEFNTLSLHRTWQQGDNWQLIAPDSTDGRGGPNWGEGGTQWWVNPFNPNTPINGIYSVSNGMLNLSLLPTPTQYQSYIDQQAGAHMPDVGALLNNSPTTYQHFGYWEMGVSVDRVPGFSFEIALENVQLTGHWPPQINIGISTDGSGNQTLQAHMYSGSTSSDYSQPIDGTQQHDYGIDWEADFITFYFDNTKIFQVPNPGGVYQADKMFAYLYTGGNYSSGTGVNPPASSLPANAHIDYFRVYDAKPQAVNSSVSIAAGNASQAEGNSGSTPFTFTVTRSGDTTGTSSVAWAVTGSGGSPANAADFTGGVLPSGTLSFTAGQTSQTISVNVAGDTTVEADEGFTVTLSNPSAGTTIGTAAATGTILNDDALASQLSIAAGNASQAEGNSGSTPFTFTVTRSGDTTGTSSVAWAVTGSGGSPANAADFAGGVLPSGTLSFAAGQTSQTITVNVAGDTTVEPDEGFTVTLSNRLGGDHHRHRRRDRHHPQRRRAGLAALDRGGQRQPGGGQFRQHAVHLHGHPFGRHDGDEQRGLGGDRQRRQSGERGGLRRRRAALGHAQLRRRPDQPDHHRQRRRRHHGRGR